MKTAKLLIEFVFWGIVVIGLIIANTPYMIMGIAEDYIKNRKVTNA